MNYLHYSHSTVVIVILKYIVKYDLFLNKSFNVNEYLKYCQTDIVVPKELKKYFLYLTYFSFY